MMVRAVSCSKGGNEAETAKFPPSPDPTSPGRIAQKNGGREGIEPKDCPVNGERKGPLKPMDTGKIPLKASG